MDVSRRDLLKGGAVLATGALASAGVFALGSCTSGPENEGDAAEAQPVDADIIIVGGGMGGLSAALAAAQNEKSAILFEKLPTTGGDSAYSGGQIRVAGAKIQEEYGADCGDIYTLIEFRTDEKSPYVDVEKPLVTTLYKNTVDLVNMLCDSGVPMMMPDPESDPWFTQCEGKGGVLMEHINGFVEDAGGADIRTDTPVTALLVENGNVVGVKVDESGEEKEYRSKAVILATGGYYKNPDLVNKYAPSFNGVYTYGAEGSDGDGLLMAQDIGASTFGFGGFNAALNTSVYYKKDGAITMSGARNAFLKAPAVLVNANGVRVINEDYPFYDIVAKAIMSSSENTGYAIFDDVAAGEYDILASEIEAGNAVEHNSLEELAANLNIPAVTETIAHYNEMVDKGVDEDFGRVDHFKKLTGSKFYSIENACVAYLSYAGLDVDDGAHVLDNYGNQIPGLYACGEICVAPEPREGLLYIAGLANAFVYGKIGVETAIKDLSL